MISGRGARPLRLDGQDAKKMLLRPERAVFLTIVHVTLVPYLGPNGPTPFADEKTIREYIKKQEAEDKRLDQLQMF